MMDRLNLDTILIQFKRSISPVAPPQSRPTVVTVTVAVGGERIILCCCDQLKVKGSEIIILLLPAGSSQSQSQSDCFPMKVQRPAVAGGEEGGGDKTLDWRTGSARPCYHQPSYSSHLHTHTLTLPPTNWQHFYHPAGEMHH